MQLSEVFIEGQVCSEDILQVSLSSASILFILRYCSKGSKSIKLHIVENVLKNEVLVPVEKSSLNYIDHNFLSSKDCPVSCQLPIIVEENGILVRSGQCSVIRQIIAVCDKIVPQEKLIDLLGFRHGSLKACAEISGWTKLCEVELPTCIGNMIECVRENAAKAEIEINVPKDLMKLEHHFSKPTVIHNDDKLKRKLLKNVQEEAKDFDGSKPEILFESKRKLEDPHCIKYYEINGLEDLLCNKKTLNIEIPRSYGPVDELIKKIGELTIDNIHLCHIYAEGMTITVADLIIFTYIYYLQETLQHNTSYLGKYIPKILIWAKQMLSLEKIIQTCLSFGMQIEPLKCYLFDKCSENKSIHFHPHPDDDILEDEMQLSRRCKGKHRAIKPEVAHALTAVQESAIHVVEGKHPVDNVKLKWNTLPEGIHPGKNLPKERLARKCEQLENLVTAVMSVVKCGDIVVDFCSGGGHLGIALAHFLPKCQIQLVENNENALLRAKSRVQQAGLKNVTLFQCNQDYFCGHFDIGVSLHACGSATDMVLKQCIKNKANFVICPCCYGGIQNTHFLTYPQSNTFQASKLQYKDYLTIGHAADQTEFNIALEKQGKYCMNLIDTDRAYLAQEHGYLVELCTLSPPSCTPKNNLLIGVRKDQS